MQPTSLESILITAQDKMQQLLHTLKHETAALEKNDIEKFESIILEKLALTKEIEKNEKRRIQFLSERSLNPNEPSQWINNNKLNHLWTKIKHLSEQAQQQNQVNGLVINGNRRRVQTQIEILTSTSHPTAELIYSSAGENVKLRRSNTLARV